LQPNKIDINSLIIRELEDFEFPYDYGAWLKAEKKLNQIKHKNAAIKLLIGSILTMLSLSILLYFNTEKPREVKEVNSTNKNTSPVIIESDSTENTVRNTTDRHITEIKNKTTENKNSESEEQITESNSKRLFEETKEETKSIKYINDVQLAEDKHTAITKSKNPIPYFSISQKKGCAPMKLSFYPFEDSDSLVYYWEFGDGKISNEKNPEHQFDTEGKYFVRLSVKPYNTDKVFSWISDEPIEVLEKPLVDFEVVSPKNPYEFAVLSNPTLEYSWDFGDAAKDAGISVKHFYQKEGKYSVKLEGKNQNGCIASQTHLVEVKNLISVKFPDAFTPDGDGINDYYGPIFSPEEEIIEFNMQIFNEYGMIVFESTNIDNLWDGKILNSNRECETGIYHAVFRIKNKHNIYKEYKSKVTLLK
jgi:gliding motility-associated-like protein